MNKLKKLFEQRGALMENMDVLLGGAKSENRALSDEEKLEFDRLSDEVSRIDSTIQAEQRAEELSCRRNTGTGR